MTRMGISPPTAVDPQGVAGQFMYRIGASYWRSMDNRLSRGTLEVLVNEGSGIITHVMYRSRGLVP